MGLGARLGRWLIAIPMAILAIATIYPMLFTTNIALKSRNEYILDRLSPASDPQWENFANAWTNAGMSRYFLNSVIAVGFSVFFLLLLGSTAGFALSKMRFAGSKVIFLGILAALFIPFQVIMVPLVRTMTDIGLINTYPGLILAYVAQFLPFTVFLMTAFYSGIPDDIIDAARIDGNSMYGVYRRIMLPLGAPALLSVGILTMLFAWNDVLMALVIMPSAENRTLMVGVTALRGQYFNNIPVFAAGVLISVIPVLAVYLFFQRQIAAGITAGSAKG